MSVKRATRVASLLREVLSEIIATQIKDPAVGRITVSRVSVTDDLRSAKVYYNMLGTGEEREAALAGLNRARGFVRSELGKRTTFRRVPELQFVYDDTLDYAERIEELLKQIHKPDSTKSQE